MSEDDMFNTRYEDKEVEIDDGFVFLGDDINLFEKIPHLHRLRVGMGWELNVFDGEAVDLDVSLFFLDRKDQTREDGDFVFYNAPMSFDGAVKLHGDSRTGAGEGDDEIISVDLHGIPFDIIRIAVFLSIYQGLEKDQSLGMVRNTYVRIVDEITNHEILRYSLNDAVKERPETGIVVGYLDREGPKWHFKPAAEYHMDGMASYARSKGLIIIDQ
ncbi:MAG: TerD family protein [Alphaproteobacteria bacterium]